jgi:hypothetical protein
MHARQGGRRPSLSLIISLLALFVAISGTAYAATVGTADIQNGAVTTPKIKGGAVTTNKLAGNAVTAQKIATQAVGPAKIAATAVRTAKIADAAVTTAKIADAAVTTAKIADAAVTNVKLANGSVSNAKLGTNSVTSTKIADGQVRAPDLGAINQRTNSTTINAGAFTSVVVTCNAGERVISGGHSNNGVNVVNSDSFRDGNGWRAYFRNNEGVQRTITARAYCLAP